MQFPHDSNLDLNCILNILYNTYSQERKLPPIIKIHLDNCSRENKNKFIIGFFFRLVEKRLINEVKLKYTSHFLRHCLIYLAKIRSTQFRIKILQAAFQYLCKLAEHRIGRPPSSVVCLSIRGPHSLNISSETAWPLNINFHMELPWDEGKKACSNGPGHMTKMAAILKYGKNLKKSSSPEPKGRWPWNLVCCIGCSSTTKFVQMMTLGWPWTILRQGWIWALRLLYGKKVKQWIFQKLF